MDEDSCECPYCIHPIRDDFEGDYARRALNDRETPARRPLAGRATPAHRPAIPSRFIDAHGRPSRGRSLRIIKKLKRYSTSVTAGVSRKVCDILSRGLSFPSCGISACCEEDDYPPEYPRHYPANYPTYYPPNYPTSYQPRRLAFTTHSPQIYDEYLVSPQSLNCGSHSSQSSVDPLEFVDSAPSQTKAVYHPEVPRVQPEVVYARPPISFVLQNGVVTGYPCHTQRPNSSPPPMQPIPLGAANGEFRNQGYKPTSPHAVATASRTPNSSRQNWNDKIHKITETFHNQQLHIHTLILPAGVRPDDPRLKKARVIRRNSYYTDIPSFPAASFFGKIDPGLDPSGGEEHLIGQAEMPGDPYAE